MDNKIKYLGCYLTGKLICRGTIKDETKMHTGWCEP